MALTSIEAVRTGIGDFTVPYILTNDQIQHYLTSNSNVVADTVNELQPIILSALASRGNANRIEELWEDNSSQAPNYEKALKASKTQAASGVVPMIGGCTTEVTISVDQFDPDNWGDDDLL